MRISVTQTRLLAACRAIAAQLDRGYDIHPDDTIVSW